jgi:hypothetical protein
MTEKMLTRQELEKLMHENDESLTFVQKKKTSKSSEMWEHFHQIFVNNVQQQFVSCDECKTILAFTSANGTNNLKTHLSHCKKIKTESNDLNQTPVHAFYSSSKHIEIPKKIKLSVTQACAEYAALDGRAFESIKGEGFQGLAQILFDSGRLLHKSHIQVKDLLPHPTTVRVTRFSLKNLTMIFKCLLIIVDK